MTLVKAVPYRKFIEVLYLMDACIPSLPSDAGRSFMVYQHSGSGYMQIPGGPRCPIMSRNAEEMVPAFEIEKIVGLLGFPLSVYISTVGGCQVAEDSNNASSSDTKAAG